MVRRIADKRNNSKYAVYVKDPRVGYSKTLKKAGYCYSPNKSEAMKEVKKKMSEWMLFKDEGIPKSEIGKYIKIDKVR